MFLMWLLVGALCLGAMLLFTFRTARTLAQRRAESDFATRLSGFVATPFFLGALGCAYKMSGGLTVVLITSGVSLVMLVLAMSYGFKVGGRMKPPVA